MQSDEGGRGRSRTVREHAYKWERGETGSEAATLAPGRASPPSLSLPLARRFLVPQERDAEGDRVGQGVEDAIGDDCGHAKGSEVGRSAAPAELPQPPTPGPRGRGAAQGRARTGGAEEKRTAWVAGGGGGGGGGRHARPASGGKLAANSAERRGGAMAADRGRECRGGRRSRA